MRVSRTGIEQPEIPRAVILETCSCQNPWLRLPTLFRYHLPSDKCLCVSHVECFRRTQKARHHIMIIQRRSAHTFPKLRCSKRKNLKWIDPNSSVFQADQQRISSPIQAATGRYLTDLWDFSWSCFMYDIKGKSRKNSYLHKWNCSSSTSTKQKNSNENSFLHEFVFGICRRLFSFV